MMPSPAKRGSILLAALEELKLRVGKNDGKLHLAKGQETVNRNLGKICGKYTRAAKFYTFEDNQNNRTISWHRDDEKYKTDS